jgi:hypothetical protein
MDEDRAFAAAQSAATALLHFWKAVVMLPLPPSMLRGGAADAAARWSHCRFGDAARVLGEGESRHLRRRRSSV